MVARKKSKNSKTKDFFKDSSCFCTLSFFINWHHKRENQVNEYHVNHSAIVGVFLHWRPYLSYSTLKHHLQKCLPCVEFFCLKFGKLFLGYRNFCNRKHEEVKRQPIQKKFCELLLWCNTYSFENVFRDLQIFILFFRFFCPAFSRVIFLQSLICIRDAKVGIIVLFVYVLCIQSSMILC